jgi:pyruvate ferredoxin oxidoreductase gamma subunit
MDKKYFEIRWHGRGGLGAKTAALLLGEAFIQFGKYAQAFPEYGPERRGAPVTAYTRISNEPIRIHYGILKPDMIIVLDSRLLKRGDTLSGFDFERGKLLVNYPKDPKNLMEEFGISAKNIFTVDSTKIAIETIGYNIPNTPMLGAFLRVTGLLPLDAFIEFIDRRLSKKYSHDLVKGNLKAIERAFREVKGVEESRKLEKIT